MRNYYSELKLSPDLDFEEIQDELLRLEQLWRRREVNSPDRAAEKLVLINEAKKVFASPSSKVAYDRELENSQRKPATSNPQEERYQQYQKWYKAALQYDNNHQADLAKTAIENALSYADPERVTPDFYCAVCWIFRSNKEFQTAMSYINKAIVMAPENSIYYIEKAFTYREWYQDPNTYDNNKRSFPEEEKIAVNIALDLADRQGDRDALGKALGYMACLTYSDYWGKKTFYAQMAYREDGSVYAVNPIPDEIKKAEEYAKEAVEYGDAWHNGDKVIDQVNSIYEARRSNAKLAKQQWKEAQLREQQAAIEKKIAEEKAKNERISAAKRAAEEKKKESRHPILITFGIICVVGFILIVLLNLFQNLSNSGYWFAGIIYKLLSILTVVISGAGVVTILIGIFRTLLKK